MFFRKPKAKTENGAASHEAIEAAAKHFKETGDLIASAQEHGVDLRILEARVGGLNKERDAVSEAKRPNRAARRSRFSKS